MNPFTRSVHTTSVSDLTANFGLNQCRCDAVHPPAALQCRSKGEVSVPPPILEGVEVTMPDNQVVVAIRTPNEPAEQNGTSDQLGREEPLKNLRYGCVEV